MISNKTNMKTAWIIFLFLLVLSPGCSKEPDQLPEFYDSMHFVRQGGDQMDFNLVSTYEPDSLAALVNEYLFQDTILQIMIGRNSANTAAFTAFEEAMRNQRELEGDFQQPTSQTGTWVYIYFVREGNETEVTNTELRNSLATFEGMVINKMQ
jgi:hypothetical protein